MEPSPRLEVIVTLPGAIGFRRDALGREYRTKIGDLSATIVLPSFRKRHERYYAVAPIIKAVRPDVDWDKYLDTYAAWGSVSSWRTAPPSAGIVTAHITHVLVRVDLQETADVEAVAKEIVDRLHASAQAWWYRLKDWVEVVTYQTLDGGDLPENMSLVENTRAWVWTGTRGLTVPVEQMLYVVGGNIQALTTRQWERLLSKTASMQEPPTMHLLLRNGRRALREGQGRLALLEVATAAELALMVKFDQRFSVLPARAKTALRKQHRELGRLVGLLSDMGEALPAKIQDNLIKLRNEAIHAGTEPTINQARQAYDIAVGLVESVQPRTRLGRS